jgi:hypothetical protein
MINAETGQSSADRGPPRYCEALIEGHPTDPKVEQCKGCGEKKYKNCDEVLKSLLVDCVCGKATIPTILGAKPIGGTKYQSLHPY